MKHYTSIIALAALSLSLGACQQQKGAVTPDAPATGSTYAGLRVTIVSNQTLAPTENDNPGRAEESDITAMDFLSTAENKSFTFDQGTIPSPLTVDQDKFWKTATDNYVASPWRTKAGAINFALVLNKGTLPVTGVPVIDREYQLPDGDQVTTLLAKDNGFVMTSEVVDKTIKDGISKDEVANQTNGGDENKNVFALDAERVVAQGIIIDGTQNGKIMNGEEEIGTLSGLKFGGSMGASRTYIFRNHAGDRTMGADSKYDGYRSAVHDVTVTKYNATTGKPKYENGAWTSDYLTQNADALKNFRLAELTDLDLFKSADVTDLKTAFKKAGFYFLENSMKEPASHFDWAFTRSAYGKVYGTFKPAHVYQYKDSTFVAQSGTGNYYDPNTKEAKDQNDGGVEGKIVYTRSEVNGFTAGTDFYVGEKDHLFYATNLDAKKSETAPGQKSYKYTDGTVTYRVPWNWQKSDNGETAYADTRRNNIYVVTISLFKELGLNYDPADPNDPNNPADDNPDEPLTPPDGGDPSFDKTETYMNVNTKVLQWNVVSREHVADAM